MLALAARGAARPVAGARRRALPGGGDGFRIPALDRAGRLRAPHRDLHRRGDVRAGAEHLAELAELGVTAIEIMPVAEFPGARGWGYDGVYISAAQSSYGGPEGWPRWSPPPTAAASR